jgi:hypothetical protein
MTLIDNITAQPSQKMNLILPDNTIISDFYLTYMDDNQGWFFGLTYGTFVINNMRLVVNPNILRAFNRVIPFSLGVDTTDGYENLFINDFSTRRASLYLLDADDITEVESRLDPGYNALTPGFIPWGN